MITITDTELEDTLKSLLQQKLEFVMHGKKWRSGRLLLFKQSGFYIELTIKNDKNKIERFEIPIPFGTTQLPGVIKFSYELNTLICNDSWIMNEIKKISPRCRNKYFNNYMEIRYETG